MQEDCSQPLGLEDGRIEDSQIRASSSYSPESVGPSAGRLNSEKGGGAWCPKRQITKNMKKQEFLEINLHSNHVITAVVTQGRFANGQGVEFAEFYVLQYWKEGMENFVDYVDDDGEKVLEANKNTFSESKQVLSSAIVASKVRIIPYSQYPRTVCMRIELEGCFKRKSILDFGLNVIHKNISNNQSEETLDNIDRHDLKVENKDFVEVNESQQVKKFTSEAHLIHADKGWSGQFLGIVVGVLLTVILFLVILIIIILQRNRSTKSFPSLGNISISHSFTDDNKKSNNNGRMDKNQIIYSNVHDAKSKAPAIYANINPEKLSRPVNHLPIYANTLGQTSASSTMSAQIECIYTDPLPAISAKLDGQDSRLTKTEVKEDSQTHGVSMDHVLGRRMTWSTEAAVQDPHKQRYGSSHRMTWVNRSQTSGAGWAKNTQTTRHSSCKRSIRYEQTLETATASTDADRVKDDQTAGRCGNQIHIMGTFAPVPTPTLFPIQDLQHFLHDN